MHSKKLLPIISVFMIMEFLSLCHAKPGWLKVCSGEDTYEIHAGGCPNGVNLKNPIKVSCVCVNGVWVLAKDSCDKMPIILVGKGDCFDLEGTRISSMKFIGRPSSPFTARSYLGTEYLNGFWKISTSLDSEKRIPKLRDVSIIQINSDKVVTGWDVACCMRDSLSQKHPVHICLHASNTRYFLQSKCLPSSKHNNQLSRIALNFGQGVQLSGTTRNETNILSASPACLACSSSRSSSKVKKPTFETDCCRAFPFEDILDDSHVDPKRYEKQTNRMTGKYMKYMKKHKRGEWTVNTHEFNHLRYASLILSKVCPVPRDLLNTFVRFFRYLVNESISELPMEKTIDDYQHGRIVQTLEICLKLANEDQWKIEKSVQSCDAEFDTVITQNKTIKMNPTPHTKFHTKLKDLTIETVWMIIKFVASFCSASFVENPTDLDYLLTGLQKLITADLTKRWYNPGKSYEAIHFLLHGNDLLLFMGHLKMCAEAAESFAIQKRILVPPTVQEEPKNKLQSESIWEDEGTCLMSYWYPFPTYNTASCPATSY